MPFFSQLFSPQRAFIDANDQFEHTLRRKSNIIFLIVGFISEFRNIFTDLNRAYFSSEFHALIVVISAIIGFFLIRFVIVPILYFLGRALKSKAEFIDVRIILVYSMIPLIVFILPLELYLGINDLYRNMTDSLLLLSNSIKMVTVIWSSYIMFSGFLFFGQYNWIRAIINMSPFFLILTVSIIKFVWFLLQY
ncbi:MAG: YIP1 family protein [Bacteroidota bacterium]